MSDHLRPISHRRSAWRLAAAGAVSWAALLASAPGFAAAMPAAAKQAAQTAPQQVAPGQVPTGMSASDWASVQRQITAQRYRVAELDGARGAYRADNPSLGLAARFRADSSTRV